MPVPSNCITSRDPVGESSFWRSIEIEVDANPDNNLLIPLTKGDVLEAIRSELSSHSDYPEVVDIGFERDIVDLGLFRLAVFTPDGEHLRTIPVWVLPKAPA